MIVNVVVTKIIAAYILRRIQSQLRWMERDSGEAKQSNSYQKKYSNFKYLSGLISCQLIDQYSQSIKHHSDFNWFRFRSLYAYWRQCTRWNNPFKQWNNPTNAVKQSDLKQLNILCKFPLFLYYSVINSNCHKVKAYLACLRTFYIKTPLVKIVPEIGKFIIELKK